MARVKNSEIESAIEMFVNSVYDDPQSGWTTASEKEWVWAVYMELTDCKREHFGTFCTEYASPVNRFEGKDNLIARIRPILEMRLLRLAKQLDYFNFTPDHVKIALLEEERKMVYIDGMAINIEELPIIAEDEANDAVLVRLENELLDSVLLIYHPDRANEEVYVLDDMQGSFPTTFDEVPDHDWHFIEFDDSEE